jgi:hypothetical protein
MKRISEISCTLEAVERDKSVLTDGLNHHIARHLCYRLQKDKRTFCCGWDVDDRLCGIVVRVLGYKSGGPGSIPGTTKKSSGSGTGSTQPREYN